jgi:hypothetical protein
MSLVKDIETAVGEYDHLNSGKKIAVGIIA